MSIRIRLTLALILIGVLPAALIVYLANQTFTEINTLAIEEGRGALEAAGQSAIKEKAESVAAQISIYLTDHPRLQVYNAALLQADPTLAQIAVQPVGKTGYTAVHYDTGLNIFHSNPKIVNTNLAALQQTLPDFWNIVSRTLDGTSGEGYYDWKDADGSIRPKYMAIVPVPNTPLRVAATTYIDEFSAPVIATTQNLNQRAESGRTRLLLTAGIASLAAFLVAVLTGNRLTAPLSSMAQAAEKVSGGDWEAIQPSQSRDEVGSLSRAMWSMAKQLHGAVENLEAQVGERTKELARRSNQLEATAQVVRDVVRARNLDVLLNNAVDLVRDRFGFYHAGIFLVDEPGEYAVLSAATGEAGREMLENEHKLKIGETGIVGLVTATGRARIALDVGQDAVHFRNPLLPATRSEMALPLKTGTQVIGALDVQAMEESAFDEEDIAIMQTLADQLAIAIENIRSVERAETAYREVAAVYERQASQMWQAHIQGKPTAFEYNRFKVQPINGQIPASLRTKLESGRAITLHAAQLDAEKSGNQSVLLIPIMLRNQVLGVIGLEKEDPNYQWTGEEISAAETIAGQTAVALENARLLEEAQQRAAKERTISDATTKISGAFNIESILRATAEELERVLGNAELVIQFQQQDEERPSIG